MKMGKDHLHAGHIEKAKMCFSQALVLVVDYDRPYRDKRGIVEHRLADIVIRKNEIERARWLLKTATREMVNAQVGRAICLRE